MAETLRSVAEINAKILEVFGKEVDEAPPTAVTYCYGSYLIPGHKPIAVLFKNPDFPKKDGERQRLWLEEKDEFYETAEEAFARRPEAKPYFTSTRCPACLQAERDKLKDGKK